MHDVAVAGTAARRPGTALLSRAPVAELTDEFKLALRELVPLLLAPARLRVKRVAGRPLTARELPVLLRTYLDEFNTRVPSPQTMLSVSEGVPRRGRTRLLQGPARALLRPAPDAVSVAGGGARRVAVRARGGPRPRVRGGAGARAVPRPAARAPVCGRAGRTAVGDAAGRKGR